MMSDSPKNETQQEQASVLLSAFDPVPMTWLRVREGDEQSKLAPADEPSDGTNSDPTSMIDSIRRTPTAYQRMESAVAEFRAHQNRHGTYVVFAVCIFLFLTSSSDLATPSRIKFDDKSFSHENTTAVSNGIASGFVEKKAELDCTMTCREDLTRHADVFRFNADLSSAQQMLDRVAVKRNLWVRQLKEDYGAADYQEIFEPLLNDNQRVPVGKNLAFRSPLSLGAKRRDSLNSKQQKEGPGWWRMVRKMQLKVLQVQLGIIEERKHKCCGAEDGEVNHKKYPEGGKEHFSSYIWATGGDGITAGQGNFFRESYTEVMSRSLQGIFNAVGIDFTAKNFAMRDATSGEETALCLPSIFGHKIDTLVWDYGRTDGEAYWKLLAYAYRAVGMANVDQTDTPYGIPHRPALFTMYQEFETNNHPPPGYMKATQTLEKLGLPILAWDSYVEEHVLSKFPDMLNLENYDKDSMLFPLLLHMKCGSLIEKGRSCSANKFNNTICENRLHISDNEFGFKYHALKGNILASVMVEVLVDALKDLAAIERPHLGDLVKQEEVLRRHMETLNEAEEKNYKQMLDWNIPNGLKVELQEWFGSQGKNQPKGVDIESLLKQPALCHTARLPSEIRFKGILTENITATTTSILDQTYEFSHLESEVLAMENPESTVGDVYLDARPERANKMLMVQPDKPRYQRNCMEPLSFDSKDSFYLSSHQGWQELTVPNDSELGYFSEFDPRKTKGWVLFCLENKEFRKYLGQLEMSINDIAVTGYSEMHDCHIMERTDKDGTKSHVWKPNVEGKYEIQTRLIDTPGFFSHVKFSSFILL